MKQASHSGLINSSEIVLFLIVAGLLAKGMASPFYIFGEFAAWCIIFLYAVILYVVWHWLRQFADENQIFIYILISLLFFPLIAGVVLNGIFGPLQEGVVPALHGIGIINWQVVQVEALPSVLMNYGTFVFAFGLLLTMPLEWLYGKVFRVMPIPIRQKFASVDTAVDERSMDFTDRYFYASDKGLLVGVLTLLIFLILNVLLLQLGN